LSFDWALYWPDPTIPPILDPLDSVAAIANEKNINLVISLFNPPVWAITAQGPSPESTSQLVIQLATRYPGTALAFELFPGANTYAGWSASPSPKKYTDLLQTVSAELISAALDIHLISTLSPLLPGASAKNIPDDDFLNGLYQSGWQSGSSILGIRYPQITGDTLAPSSASGIPVLRHYEDLRNILINHHDEHRLIWITGFSWPIELADVGDPAGEQALWLFQAFRLLAAQLYIGAAFFEQLNPNSALGENISLLQSNGRFHPACSLISQATNPTNIIVPDPDQKNSLHSLIYKVISK
jgi:hypothetical protein